MRLKGVCHQNQYGFESGKKLEVENLVTHSLSNVVFWAQWTGKILLIFLQKGFISLYKFCNDYFGIKVSQRYFIWPVLCLWGLPYRWLKNSPAEQTIIPAENCTVSRPVLCHWTVDPRKLLSVRGEYWSKDQLELKVLGQYCSDRLFSGQYCTSGAPQRHGTSPLDCFSHWYSTLH